MTRRPVTYREARETDLPAITIVRTSVLENHLSVEQMAARGISEESVAASFRTDSQGWVALDQDHVVGFSIADRKSSSIFALFVLPVFDRQGIGSRLLRSATEWLWENGGDRIWLETRKGTRAEEFYRQKGWQATRIDNHGNVHFELARP